MRIVVDLPAPLRARKPKTSPCATSSETLSTATKSPKRLTRFSRRTAGPVVLGDTFGLVTLGFFLMNQRHENFFERRQDRVTFALPFALKSGWRIAANQAALVNHADAIRALGFVEISGADENGEPVLDQLVENRPEIATRDGIDAVGRFVEKQHARLVQQRAHQRQLLFHAAG